MCSYIACARHPATHPHETAPPASEHGMTLKSPRVDFSLTDFGKPTDHTTVNAVILTLKRLKGGKDSFKTYLRFSMPSLTLGFLIDRYIFYEDNTQVALGQW